MAAGGNDNVEKGNEIVVAGNDLEVGEASSSDVKVKPVPLWRVFAYADGRDKITLAIGVTGAAASGIVAPMFAIILGQSVNATSGEAASVMASMAIVIKATAVLCLWTVFCVTTWQTCFMWSSARIATRMRILHLRKIMSHDIAWFDRCGELAALPAKLGTQSQALQDAIGTKLGDAIGCASMFLAGLTIAFIFSWKLTLVLCAVLPFLMLFAGVFSKTLKEMLSQQEAGFSSAGAVAQEAISSIRTVVAFGGEQHEVEKFSAQLEPARRAGVKAGVSFGLALGVLLGSLGCLYAFSLWFGAKELIAAEGAEGGTVITVCIAMIIGLSGLVNVGTPLMAVLKGSVAMGELTAMVATASRIESGEEEAAEGALPPEAARIESIELRDVCFRYPRQLEAEVLRGIRLTIRRGDKVALVGESGSGKSTVLQLLERFYDPVSGEVLVNGIPLTWLPVKAWRRQIGYVGQEPVLFDTSVMANIKGGNPAITDDQAVEAARQARAYDFVRSLPDKFETQVSAGGEQMSGGQKQRIAIARALVKKPQLLLLDEATSALDNESERQVQVTLDALQTSVGSGLTTITIAHRLSTVRNSDTIFVLRNGSVLEQGSHTELLSQEGEYFRLVQAQTGTNTSSNNETDLETNLEAPVEDEGTDALQAPSAGRPSGPSLPMLLGRGPCAEGADEGEKSKPGTGRAGAITPVVPNNSAAQPSSLMRSRTMASAKSNRTSKSWVVAKKDSTEAENEKTEAVRSYRAPVRRLFGLSRREWPIYPVAIVFAWIVGAIIPLQSYLFTMAFGKLYEMPVEVMLRDVSFWCWLLLLSGVLNLFCQIGMHGLFSYIQECLVKRLRELTFKSALRQEMSFFDCLENGGAGFIASMARDTVSVSMITSGSLGLSLASGLAILTGLVIAFWASWRLSLVLIAMMPLLVVGMAAAGIVTSQASVSKPHEKAGATACEALLNVRTVRALQAEGQTMKIFNEAMHKALANDLWAAPRKGFVLGVAYSLSYPVFVAGLWYGGYLVQYQGLNSTAVYLALLCILTSFSSVTMIIGYVPQAAQGRVAAHGLFSTIDRTSEIDACKPTGWHRSLGSGNIVFDNVVFQYPNRLQAPVLQGLSFNVASGQAVALVGPSGSGKTTVTQLLQRFYDPAQGSIKVGGVDLRQFDIAWWRRQIGFVGQEPVLFDVSLEDNVRYGAPEATKAEVEAAAQEANMDYVFNGTVAWAEKLGFRGQRLSGGQKQRCAIARALVRRPQILILDEATSALDSASEHLVQQALETAKSGRTTFTIAHRLSTVVDSDLILVLTAGAIVESGSHEELMGKEGVYYSMVQQGIEQ